MTTPPHLRVPPTFRAWECPENWLVCAYSHVEEYAREAEKLLAERDQLQARVAELTTIPSIVASVEDMRACMARNHELESLNAANSAQVAVMRKRIAELEAAQRWIPCSERTPALTITIPPHAISSGRQASPQVLGLFHSPDSGWWAEECQCGVKAEADWGSAQVGELFWMRGGDRCDPPLAWMELPPAPA